MIGKSPQIGPGLGWLMATCTLLLMCSGCQPDSPRRPLTGSVKYQGQPITDGVITFLSTGERSVPVCGALLVNGKFTVPSEQGLEPGKYRVVISWPGGPAPRTPDEIAAGASARATERIPSQYNAETKLTVDVEATGKNDFTLDLN